MSDLINRQAALDAIDKNRGALLSSGMAGAEHILVHYGRRVIEELPTIEPKHGRWIDVSGATICSWCSSNSEMEHYFRKGYRADYCPMCGARMDEDER